MTINEKPGTVGFGRGIKDFFKGYVAFKGRSTRAGYWWATLFVFLMSLALALLASLVGLMLAATLSFGQGQNLDLSLVSGTFYVLFSLFFLGLFLPILTLTIRRLRDVGLSLAFILGLLIVSGLLGLASILFSSVIGLSIILNLFSAFFDIVLFIFVLLPTDYLTVSESNFYFRKRVN